LRGVLLAGTRRKCAVVTVLSFRPRGKRKGARKRNQPDSIGLIYSRNRHSKKRNR